MKKIRSLTQRSPIAFCIIFILIIDAIIFGLKPITNLLPKSNLFSAIKELIHIAWPILLVVLLGYGFACRAKGFFRSFKAGWGYLVLFSLSLLITVISNLLKPNIQWASWDTLLVGLLSIVGIGIREEVLYRGVVVNALGLKYVKDVKGLWFTEVVSALLFGFIHITNIFFGVPAINVLIQSLGAAGLGMGFVAIYLRGGNVWFIAIVHTIVDLGSLFQSTFLVNNITDQDVIKNLGLVGMFVQIVIGIFVALFLLRKSKRQEIFDRYDTLRGELDGFSAESSPKS